MKDKIETGMEEISIKRLGGILWYIIDAAHFYFTT